MFIYTNQPKTRSNIYTHLYVHAAVTLREHRWIIITVHNVSVIIFSGTVVNIVIILFEIISIVIAVTLLLL